MTQFRRNDVNSASVHATTNAGLWLDKYYHDSADPKEEAKQVFVQEIVGTIQIDRVYNKFFERWKEALHQAGVQTKAAHTSGRLVVNLGADSVLEANIALHHTYGVPYIPGSALKGLAAHFAHQSLDDPLWKKGGQAHEIMFGNTNSAGYVTFFDALYIPSDVRGQKALYKDVMTVHHPEYYQQGNVPPADYDKTSIIPFITAHGSFLIALTGPEAWVDKAFEILEMALEKEGVGAKTSSGYGRMTFKVTASETGTAIPSTSYASERNRLIRETPPTGRFRGTIQNVNPDGRYAKISPARGGAAVFVHINQMLNKHPIQEGQVVEYSMGEFNGKPQAQNVNVLLEKM